MKNSGPYPQSSTFGPTPLLVFPPLNDVLGYSRIFLKSVNNDINILTYSIACFFGNIPNICYSHSYNKTEKKTNRF